MYNLLPFVHKKTLTITISGENRNSILKANVIIAGRAYSAYFRVRLGSQKQREISSDGVLLEPVGIKRFSNCRLPTENRSESQKTARAESSFRHPYRETCAHSQRSTKKDQTRERHLFPGSPIRGKNLRKKLESVFSGLVKADIFVESVAPRE